MRYIFFILFPFILLGQNLTGSDAIYFNGSQADKVYLNGEEVWTDVAAPTERYTVANAISVEDEANSNTGISEVGTGTLDDPVSGGAQSGTYHARFTGGGGTSERAEIAWSGFTSGQHIRFFIWVKVSGSGGYFNAWTNVQTIGGGTADPQAGGAPYNFSDSTWTNYTFDLELTSTSGIVRIYSNNGSTAQIDFDSFSMTEL